MTRNSKILWLVWALLAVVGGVGLIERLATGHRLVAYSSYVPWGIWVAGYIYFSGLSAGAFLFASLAYVFRVRALERVARLALFVAVTTLVMALVTISLDLGHAERSLEVFFRPRFHSMMAWMVWLYAAYAVLLVAALWFALRRDVKPSSVGDAEGDDRTLRLLAVVGIPLTVAFGGGVGALFGTVSARAFWHGPLYPILFLVGALLSGGALLTFMVAVFWSEKDERWKDLLQTLSRIVLGLVLGQLLLEWAEFSVPLWYGVGPGAGLVRFVLFGPFWWVYWIVHVLLGVAAPVYLLTRSDRPGAVTAGSALVAVTFFAVRLNLVIPGLVTPELRGLDRAYVDPIGAHLSYRYLPTLLEWQVLMGVLALGIAIFYLGQRRLPLLPRPNTNEVTR